MKLAPVPDRLNAAQLRERAREHRRAAERADDLIRREAFMTIAVEYERLADAMEEDRNRGRRNQ